MKKIYSILMALMLVVSASAQEPLFPEEISLPENFVPETIVMPPSPLTMQVLFVGGVDWVQTTPTYGYEAGQAYAKEWHDFIGFTPDETDESLGWVSINHEMIYQDDRIGDGGGMTAFRVKRDPMTDTLMVVHQDLEDGRSGYFFNVDFANTVGETGMNCGGIVSLVDGRIWTAEEWFRTSNSSINNGNYREATGDSWYPKSPAVGRGQPNEGVRDTTDWTVSSDIPGWDGLTLKKFQNFNYMVEIDPRQAKAVRKQFNWGRQGFEGGAVSMDNSTVYLGVDATPAFWAKFVADTPGDFTKGTTYVYKHDDPNKWVAIDDDPETLLNFNAAGTAAGATMYNRIEWVAMDSTTGRVYWTETGRDTPGSRWADEFDGGAVHDPYHIDRATANGWGDPNSGDYKDYYGRVWVYDPGLDSNYVVIEGGPEYDAAVPVDQYPETHLSNPDGLSVIYIDGVPFLLIQEDLNGTSNGRMPEGISNRTCEVFLLKVDGPAGTYYTVDELIRLTAVPAGAEVTGGIMTSDGKSVLLNSQHPNSDNKFPFNHSLTFALNGFDKLTVTNLTTPDLEDNGLEIYPNPTTRIVHFNETVDVALYGVNGQRLRVWRKKDKIDVSGFAAGVYILKTESGKTKKLVIE